MKIGLFVIDPQNDFCDPSGALSVVGADKDMDRLANMVDRLGPKIKNIFVTMDSHHTFDIAHPNFWVDKDLNHPPIFTVISMADVMNGTWRAANPSYQRWVEEYVQGLDAKKRFALCIWPPHCLIGSWGNNIYPSLYKSFLTYENAGGFVNYQTKGSNFKTEHYSVFEAEYPDPKDPTTAFNNFFADRINECDKVLIAGEARTHCVINSLRSLIDHTNGEFIKKMIFVKDASSDVTVDPSLVSAADAYFQDLVNKGMEITTTDKFLA